MRAPSPLRSGAFRFALMVAAVFAIGTVALLAMVEHEVSGYATEVLSDTIAAESLTLRSAVGTGPSSGIAASIVARDKGLREHQPRYLLVDRAGRRLAGSLPAGAAQPGWHNLRIPHPDPANEDGAKTMPLLALGTRLPDGAILVVAIDTSDLKELRHGLLATAAGFGLVVTLLAAIGGLVVGSLFLRRLDRVNRSVERIMRGSMAERLPAIGMSPEFDHLSANLNRMLDRIEALMESMRQVSTDIAHDLRTPLTRLRQRLETLRDAPPGRASDAQIDALLAETDRILGVFRALLRISSLESGIGRQRLGEANLSEMMERVCQAYAPVAEDSGHALAARIAPGLVGRGDAEMLTQAATNLIENALLHTPPGSAVTVTLERREQAILLAVSDNGPGVPAGEREKIVQRFYRLDSSRGTPGAGLGLALVAAIAALHEARLTLSGNDPGLRVEIELPDRADASA